jgi:prephenate dehydrogenase
MPNDTVALLGYGRFGRALGELLTEAGVDHRAYDPVAPVPLPIRAASPGDLVRGARFVVLAVPVTRMREALADLRPHLDPGQIVLDVGSVKVGPASFLAETLGDAIPWCPTHPLFGPVSLALAERPLRVVVCPTPVHRQAGAVVRSLYERIGCEVIEQTAESHDRVMAQTHALTFFVAKGMLDAGAGSPVPFAPPSFQAISRTIETVRSDAGHLFASIARENPFASEARKRLIQALVAIDQGLDAESAHRDRAEETTGGDHSRFVIPDLGDRSPELKQTRDLIDAVDRDLVRVLAQRSQLQDRAAHAKAALGAPALDPVREAEILATRRAWAEESKLDADCIADVFRAVLDMSRRSQRR